MSEKYPDWYELPKERWKDHLNYGYRDSQRQKLYDAESCTRHEIKESNIKFSSIEEIQKFTDKLVSSAWIKKRFKNVIAIKVIQQNKGRTAYAQFGNIHLPKWSWNMIVVLHEISHILHKRSPIPGTSHGRFFARCFLELVGHVMGLEVKKVLKKYYKIERVKYTPRRQITDEDRQARRERFIQNVLKKEPVLNYSI